jgi:hypothetical protein
MDQTLDVSKLSDTDKKELSQFLQNESQKTAIQQSMSLIISSASCFPTPPAPRQRDHKEYLR